MELLCFLQDSHSRICAQIRFTWILGCLHLHGASILGTRICIGLRQSTSASIFFCKTSICKHTTIELCMCLCVDVSFLGEVFQPKFAQLAILQLCSYRQDWGGEQSGLLFLRHNSWNRLKKSSQRKSTKEGQWVASVLARPFSLVTPSTSSVSFSMESQEHIYVGAGKALFSCSHFQVVCRSCMH